MTSAYILIDPGPYLDYVPIYAINPTFGDGKSMEEGAVTVLFECPGVKFLLGNHIGLLRFSSACLSVNLHLAYPMTM